MSTYDFEPDPADYGPEPAIFDITIDGEEAKLLQAMLQSPLPDDDDPLDIRLILGSGYAGYGLYVASADYPGEGAHLVHSLAAPTTGEKS